MPDPTPETRKTLCNRDCPDACGIVATVENGRVTHLAGDPDHPITRGFLCFRTGHFLEVQYSPERLTQPMYRDPRGDGSFVPVSWEFALDLAAEKLRAIRAESGPASIFHYRSGGSLGLVKHVCDYFWEQFGPVTIKRGDICSGAGDAAQMTDFGDEDSHDLFDLLNSRNVILWGKNVFVSSPHTIPVLRDAKNNGAKLCLIDPVFHKTAGLCERYHQPRPGGDFALAMATARVLFERGWTDPDAAKYCDHLDEFRALAFSRGVDDWCRDADVTAECAEDLARRLGVEKPCAILVGWGMGRRGNGAAIVRALDALCAVSGNVGVPGGGVSFYFKRRGAFDTSFVQGEKAAPRTVCEPLFGREILEMESPRIRAVWITAGNPVVMLPESETTVRALAQCEFVVTVDSYMTDTARLSHLVLPTTTLLEADDLVGSYGHHFVGSVNPVVPPPPGVKSDLEIVQGLADRVGLGGKLAGDARAWAARLAGPKLEPRGISLADLEKSAVRNPLAADVLFSERKFPTATGRVNLLTSAPPAAPDPPTDEFPLVLMALSTERSQCSQWTRPPEGPAVVTVHPEAPGAPADGTLAVLESRVGKMQVRVKHDARQRRDVALVPKGGHLRDGRCANALIRARTTDMGEGGALYDERVRLRPA